MNKINRPTASNYNELENKRQTLSGKADSVFSYRKVNPYSVVFDKLKRDKNENFSTDLWQQAANKGELDQYINLLSQNPTKSSKLSELESKYSSFLDYDTTMLALSYDAIKDDVAEERFDSDGNSIGSFSQKELIDKVLEQETLRWDAQILEDAKRSGTFWQKLGARVKSTGAEIASFGLVYISGAVRVADQSVDTLYSAATVLDEWVAHGMDMSFEQISATYAQAVTSDDRGIDLGIDATKIQESLKEIAFDIRRQYSYHTNAVTGEADWYGKILNGMADSMGYMSLAMITGNPAMMYLPMFTGNVQENVAMSGPNPDYSKIVTNAATKAGVEYGIEWGLGKLLGFTKLDNLTGIGDDAAKATKDMVVRGVTNTSAQAAKQVTKQVARDMLKEGTEEVLQELSGVFIDYLYGDQYAIRSKENFTLENFTQSFVIGAATSFAIGSFSNLTTTRATGIDANGFTYKMGMFQSVTYKQAIATMNSWQKTAMDPKASAQARLDAAMKLQGVVATLGTVYESAGIKNTIQAEKLLSEIQNYQDRKTAIKDKVQRGVYITDMLTNLDNEVGGTNWTTAFNDIANGTNNLMYDMQEAGTQRKEQNKIDKKQQAMYHSISTALNNTNIAHLLSAAGVDVFKKVVDVTGEVDKGTVFEVAKNAGYNVVVPTNGRDVIISDDVIFLPENMNDADTQALLKEIVTQNTIERIIENIPAELLMKVTETFSQAIGNAATKYEDADLTRKAIAALMFDKNFQLKMLLKTKENSNTWGTDVVLDFITKLQKQVVRKYDTVSAKTTVKTDTGKLTSLEYEVTPPNKQTYKPIEQDIKIIPFSADSQFAMSGSKTGNDLRGYIIVEYQGTEIPFYFSSGQGGKVTHGVTAKRWYPFMGMSRMWINKGSSKVIRNFYGSEALRAIAEYLDDKIGDPSQQILDALNKNGADYVEMSAAEIAKVNKDLKPVKEHDEDLTDTVKAFKAKIKPLNAAFRKVVPKITTKTTKAKSKRVLSDITKRLTERMITSLQDSIVMMNTTVKRSVTATKDGKIVVDQKLTNILSKDQLDKLINNYNIRVSATLDALAKDQMKITPEIDTMISNIATSLLEDGHTILIKSIMDSKSKTMPSQITLKAKMIKTLASGDKNARTDLVANLTTTMSYSTILSKSKAVYIPVDNSNLNEFPEAAGYKLAVEKGQLGGQSIEDVIEGNADYTKIPKHVLEIEEDFKSNDVSRIYVINQLMKQGSNNKFGILQNGGLVRITDSREFVKDNVVEAVDNNTLPEAIAQITKSKKDGVIVLQDFFKASLPKSIANMPLIITHKPTTKGYHVKDGLIYVQFGTKHSAESQLMVLLHEMTHAVNGTAFIDPRYNQFSASSSVSANILQEANDTVTPTILDEVAEYLKTNFPITSRMYNPKNKTDSTTLGTMLYVLLYEENTARSVQTLHQLSALGFDYEIKNDKAYLVSPDGKARWFIKPLAPVALSSLSELKAKMNKFERDLPSDEYIADIMAVETIEEMKDINTRWMRTAVTEVEKANTEYYSNIDMVINNYISSLNSQGITFSNAQIALLRAKLSKPTLLETIDISDTKTYTIDKLSLINEQLAKNLNRLYQLIDNIIVSENTQDPNITNELIENIGMAYSTWIINPVKSLLNSKLAQIKLAETTNEPGSSEFAAPTSFNFGDYSFTKHTGRTYMLTHKPTGQSRYTTQEVDMNTLLPTRRGQKPILTDNKMRERMLFVIAKKTEVAEKKDKEPALPEPPKKAKPNEVVFQWGAWTVKNYNKDNYIVSKTISDRATTDEQYDTVQIVSKKTLLPDTMLNAKGKPVLSATERNNILDWIAHDTGPQLLKVEDKSGDPDKDRWIYRPNLSDKNAEPMTEEAIQDFEDSDLAAEVPGNVGADYELGLTWVTRMAKFYKKYPSLRAWVEGTVDKTPENLKAFTASKDEAINLMYGELYKPQHGIKDDYKKTNKELKQQADDFLKTPIYFVRTQLNKQVDKTQPLNSVSLGYNLDTIPIFGTKGTAVFYGKILPTDLLGFLPNSYAEGILVPGHFAANAPLDYNGTEKELRNTLKSKLISPTKTTNEPGASEFAAPEVDSAGVKLTKAQSEFFKNSIARDENGNLLRMYHGTTNPRDFDTFDITTPTANGKVYSSAFYFTAELNIADHYAGSRLQNNAGPNPRPNGKIIPVYLNITNPILFNSYRRFYATVRRVLKLNNEFHPTTAQLDEYIDIQRKAKGYDGIIATHKGGFPGVVYATFNSNQAKSIFNLNPTQEAAIDRFEAPKPANRAYVSNATAKKSNLKYFIKKGKPIQMHSDVIDFVEGTTADFDKLSKFFKDRILKGKLTRHDVAKYIHTTKSINAYTWKAIAQFIYHNEALADIGPTMAKFFLDKDRLEKYAIMTRLTEDLDTTLKINSITDFKKFENEFNAKLNSDPELIDKYTKATDAATAWWSYDETGKLTKRDDLVIDEKQLLPIFMRHYDGSLKSLNDIFTLAKRQAGQQLLTSLYENTSSSGDNANANKTTKISSGNAATENNTVGAKTGSSGIYNWLDNIRKNTVDYEAAPEVEEEATTFEELTPEDKYNMLYDYLYEEELAYTDNPSEQEEYMADEDVTNALSKMSEADIDKVTQFILNEARNATPTQVATTENVDADAPARKTLKDGLRNKTRTLIRRLAGLKTNYNKLAPEVQAIINFSVNKSTMNTEAYTNLSDAELIALNDKVAAEIETLKLAQKQAQELEKTKASILRKVKALQKKERLLAEREANARARATAIKEGKTLREKLKVSYDTKVAKQTFTITGPSIINPKLQTILDHTWDKSTDSKVKYMDDSVQTIQNVHNATEFYKAHAAELSEMTLADIEDITEWLIGSNIATSDSVAKQTFEATKFFILAYIYNETGAKHIFNGMNSNLKTQLGNHLKAIQTSAGTLLSLVKQVKDKLNPVSVIAVELFDRFEYKISDIDQERLDRALSTGNVKDITQVLHDIKQDALRNLVPEKVTASRKVAAIRSMSMTSSPMTWVRNIISNIALTNLNPLSTKLGNIFFPKLTAKTENTTTQFKLNGQITPEIQTFITEQFINSGFFDETVDQISKYNPSQILRHKKAGDSDIIGDMLVHAIYNQFYSESMFDSKMFNTIHAFLMRRLSDKKWVREASVKYLGKLLAETGAHLDKNGNIKTGVDDDVMKMVANAFALATTDYMHSDNFFSHVEQWLTQNSPVFWSAYKIIMPFATASWNWFKAAVRYSPIGLGQSIYKLTQLENEIIKTETKWKKGESQIAPELATYLVRRDLGSGIIGTIAFGFGAILAALGFISLEDDDWGTPKLRIGNLRVDVSSIFGSSSALAGAAFVNTFKNTNDLGEALDAMAEPLVDGFFFTDLLAMDANSPEGWFEWSKYQAQSVMLSFIPSMVRYISGATYTGNYRAKTSFQKAVSRLPFLGQAFNVPKHTNVYTGDQDGTMWDIVHRLIPYFEIVTKSQSQSLTEQYGLNKEELNGTYVINDSPFKTDPKETARINKLYGELNADDLVDFYANKSTYRVLGANGKYATKYYSQMTETEIGNALTQLFSKNSTTAKVSAWLAAGHTYYTNDRELFNTLRALGYNNVFIGNKGFVE